MTQKMLFCFTNISADILLHILGYSICTECNILGTFLPNAVAVKSVKNHLRKKCSSLAPKMLEKLTPGANVIKQIPQ
jgi:hypothetical protein